MTETTTANEIIRRALTSTSMAARLVCSGRSEAGEVTTKSLRAAAERAGARLTYRFRQGSGLNTVSVWLVEPA